MAFQNLNIGNPLTCPDKEAGTGKEISVVQADQPDTRSLQHGALKMKSRKVKALGDVDSDYAEEAEDFFMVRGCDRRKRICIFLMLLAETI